MRLSCCRNSSYCSYADGFRQLQVMHEKPADKVLHPASEVWRTGSWKIEQQDARNTCHQNKTTCYCEHIMHYHFMFDSDKYWVYPRPSTINLLTTPTIHEKSSHSYRVGRAVIAGLTAGVAEPRPRVRRGPTAKTTRLINIKKNKTT